MMTALMMHWLLQQAVCVQPQALDTYFRPWTDNSAQLIPAQVKRRFKRSVVSVVRGAQLEVWHGTANMFKMSEICS